MRGGGRYDDQVDALGNPDVVERLTRLPQRGEDRFACQGFEGDRSDEFGRTPGERDRYPGAGLGQQAGKDAALVAGNPAGHAEQHPAALQHGATPRSADA